jgi:geranylgeranylglycerol-phosphate geranylgeranyltransferase
MPSKKLKAYKDLTRPVNVAITLVSIPAASILAGAKAGQWVEVVVAALTGGFVAAAANSINDYFDVEIDRINKPSRPIPRGDASKREAWIEWLVLSIIAIVLNFFLSTYALGIVVFAVVILYWYSAQLKRTIIIGNVVVGLMTGMAFIYGAVVVGNLTRAVMPATFAFLINIAREVIKDIEDMEGDRKGKAMTLPVRYGTSPALWMASVSIMLLIASTIAAYQLKMYTVLYLYPVLFVDVLLVTVMILMWKDPTPSAMSRLSNGLKVCMLIGLMAIFLGSPWGS